MYIIRVKKRRFVLNQTWRCISINMCGALVDSSPFVAVQLKGRTVFIKRDDLLNTHGVNGNKARKFYHFGGLNPFPLNVYSIGGPQSNSMVALAKIVAQHPSSSFYYFTKSIPNHLKNIPSGNYREALLLGMKVIVLLLLCLI